MKRYGAKSSTGRWNLPHPQKIDLLLSDVHVVFLTGTMTLSDRTISGCSMINMPVQKYTDLYCLKDGSSPKNESEDENLQRINLGRIFLEHSCWGSLFCQTCQLLNLQVSWLCSYCLWSKRDDYGHQDDTDKKRRFAFCCYACFVLPLVSDSFCSHHFERWLSVCVFPFKAPSSSLTLKNLGNEGRWWSQIEWPSSSLPEKWETCREEGSRIRTSFRAQISPTDLSVCIICWTRVSHLKHWRLQS
jgi:hypothetical protein